MEDVTTFRPWLEVRRIAIERSAIRPVAVSLNTHRPLSALCAQAAKSEADPGRLHTVEGSGFHWDTYSKIVDEGAFDHLNGRVRQTEDQTVDFRKFENGLTRHDVVGWQGKRQRVPCKRTLAEHSYNCSPA